MIIPDVLACFDWSYAELNTDVGPANIFVSHPWGEAVTVTAHAIRKFADNLQIPKDQVAGIRRADTRDTLSALLTRVWFCTLCNNQSRVQEELGGQNLLESPFTRVLRSPLLSTVIMVSPFEALERKWCNYEFCLASALGKKVLMLTEDGIVQEGHVAPATLVGLAEKLRDFDCKDAHCSNKDDERLIDAAVDKMGGYEKITSCVRRIFHASIRKAHEHTQRALRHVHEDSDNEDLRTAMLQWPQDKSLRYGAQPDDIEVFGGDTTVDVVSLPHTCTSPLDDSPI
eukprot:CAMPEP_0180432352 /NCGR_PEP_ID=MMETSP1036_2-20121128/8872_1 /TAXON_ID=632150 /ORGANISM="Azadinium spinosum, Strain 3D9" /LENGTH=284 /DNA_ID=CAMNT_0022438145 /DNA_START=101 /DNA_END=956 /DNA_ORIENTATION=+